MLAADAVSLNFGLMQIICAGMTFAFIGGLAVAVIVFVGVLVREHVKTWRKRPAFRPALAHLYR